MQGANPCLGFNEDVFKDKDMALTPTTKITRKAFRNGDGWRKEYTNASNIFTCTQGLIEYKN